MTFDRAKFVPIEQKTVFSEPEAGCHCRGPQNGQPACPCQMRGVRIVNGRYVRTTDLGPAPAPAVSIPKPGDFLGTD